MLELAEAEVGKNRRLLRHIGAAANLDLEHALPHKVAHGGADGAAADAQLLGERLLVGELVAGMVFLLNGDEVDQFLHGCVGQFHVNTFSYSHAAGADSKNPRCSSEAVRPGGAVGWLCMAMAERGGSFCSSVKKMNKRFWKISSLF